MCASDLTQLGIIVKMQPLLRLIRIWPHLRELFYRQLIACSMNAFGIAGTLTSFAAAACTVRCWSLTRASAIWKLREHCLQALRQ